MSRRAFPGNRTEILRTARKIYDIMACKDFARIDFRLSKEGRCILLRSILCLGWRRYSDFPMIAAFNGMTTLLVRGVLESALKRYGLRSPPKRRELA